MKFPPAPKNFLKILEKIVVILETAHKEPRFTRSFIALLIPIFVITVAYNFSNSETDKFQLYYNLSLAILLYSTLIYILSREKK